MNTKRQKKILNILTDIAWGSDCVAGSRHAAAIVLKNEIIAIGTNRDKTHPLQDMYKKNPHAKLLHAEIDAIRQALRVVDEIDLIRCDLYVVRVKYIGNGRRRQMIVAESKPCCGCSRAIENFNFRNVYHTTDEDENFVKLISEPQSHTLVEVTTQISP